MLSYECGGHANWVWPSSFMSYHPPSLGCGGAMVASTPYGACATVRCLPRSTALRIYYLFIPASMTGLARSSAHTVRDHATHPDVRVSCFLGALLAQLTRARRSSSGEDSGRPAAVRHPWTTPKFVIG